MRSRTLWGLIALAAALICVVVVADGVRAQREPLTITLEGPAVCETDADTFYFDIDTVPIAWTVSGGAPPYEVLINGEVFDSSSGEVDVACGRRDIAYGWRQVNSGITTVQATVTDVAGGSASALHDVYGILSVRYRGWSAPQLRSGETYRMHGLLFTVPNTLSPTVGSYLSDDCESPDETCGDRFSLGNVWLYRWTGAEYSRSFHDSSRGFRLVVRAGDDVEIPRRFRQLNEAYDRLIASIGEPPNGYADVRRGGSASGRMSLKLEMPAICSRGSDPNIPVAWTVDGGRAPYEVTIEGDRYLGQQGVANINCVAALDKPEDSGRRRIQATVVDAGGDTASARADLYVIEPRGSRRTDLTPGATYNLGRIGLITVPQDVEATIEATEHELCADPWPVETSNCEPGLILTISGGNGAASIVYGSESGREYDRSIPGGALPALISALAQMLASIGAPPTLPDDFVDASGPLRVSVAVDHPVCGPGWKVSLDWIATGGRWWPLLGEVDSGTGWTYSRDGSCGGEPGVREVRLRISESGPDPETIVQAHTINVLADLDVSGRMLFPNDAQCVAGRPIELKWWMPSAASDDARFVVTLNDAQTTVGHKDTFQLTCPAVSGRHFITVRPVNAGAPPHGDIWSGVVYVANAHPERAKP